MKTQIKIIDINHEDLVDLFSTAFFNSLNFSVTYNDSAKNIIDVDENDCFEDIMAKIAVNAKVADDKLIVFDENAEDGEVYGSLACGVGKNEEYDTLETYYYVGIKEIIKGLEAAANSSEDYIRKSFEAFVNREDDGEWDAITADILMQIIVFGEVIYG